jgi:uncharacterized protein YhdP
VTGSAHLDLSLADTVPYRVDFAMRGGDVSTLASQAGLPESVATGRANLAGSLEGALTPGVSPLADLIGSVSIEASDGLMRRTIPPVVAVALASESFNPFTSRETVRFDSVETQLEFADGRMRTESFSMDGPDLRVFASGEIDLLNAPHEIDAEVGLFLFRQIDSVVEKIPILNLLLMGTSESLIAAYFELSGPWDDPEAKLIPLRSMASSPASLVFQSIPMIMVRGIQAIGAMLAPDEKTEAAPVEVAPPAATSGS